LTIPHNFGQPEICDLNPSYPTSSYTRDKLSFICLILVLCRTWLRMSGRNERNRIEEKILGFYVTTITINSATAHERQLDH
jgi:hypothetical protein